MVDVRAAAAILAVSVDVVEQMLAEEKFRSVVWVDGEPMFLRADVEALKEDPYVRTFMLTGRETQVLQRMADGGSSKSIGEALKLSAQTIRTHRHRIFLKMGAENAPHAVAIGMRAGLIT